MLALSTATAPTSGVRWTDLLTPLESALPSCYLSYKQSSFLQRLCFHTLTNPFSRNSFPFTSIQNPRGCYSTVDSHSGRLHSWSPCLCGKPNAFISSPPLF